MGKFKKRMDYSTRFISFARFSAAISTLKSILCNLFAIVFLVTSYSAARSSWAICSKIYFVASSVSFSLREASLITLFQSERRNCSVFSNPRTLALAVFLFPNLGFPYSRHSSVPA